MTYPQHRKPAVSAHTAMTDLIKFAAKYAEKWHTYSEDHKTVAAICAASNCGLINVNQFGQFKARGDNAARYVSGL